MGQKSFETFRTILTTSLECFIVVYIHAYFLPDNICFIFVLCGCCIVTPGGNPMKRIQHTIVSKPVHSADGGIMYFAIDTRSR